MITSTAFRQLNPIQLRKKEIELNLGYMDSDLTDLGVDGFTLNRQTTYGPGTRLEFWNGLGHAQLLEIEAGSSPAVDDFAMQWQQTLSEVDLTDGVLAQANLTNLLKLILPECEFASASSMHETLEPGVFRRMLKERKTKQGRIVSGVLAINHEMICALTFEKSKPIQLNCCDIYGSVCAEQGWLDLMVDLGVIPLVYETDTSPYDGKLYNTHVSYLKAWEYLKRTDSKTPGREALIEAFLKLWDPALDAFDGNLAYLKMEGQLNCPKPI
jgi:hypothetical protein